MALAVGVALGIVDDNPLLLAADAVVFLKTFGREWSLLRRVTSRSMLNRTLDVFSKAAMGVAVAEVGLGLMGIDLAELLTGIGDAGDLSEASPIAEGLADVVEGFGALGIAFLVKRGADWLVDRCTRQKRERIWQKHAQYTVLRSLREGLRSNSFLPGLAVLVKAAKSTEFYPARL